VSAQRRSAPSPDPTAQHPADIDHEEDEEHHLDNAGDGDSSSAADTNDGMVRQNWRLISAVRAWPTTGYLFPQLLDYGHEGGKVIKRDIPKLVRQTRPDFMWDHSIEAKDVAGYVENPKWEDSKDMEPGVNADVVVDPEFDARAALGLTKGLIRSGSIGIVAEMTRFKAHEDMDDYDFYTQQGKKVNGEVVRWIPHRITAVRHMAMVPHGLGADPNAGVRNVAAQPPEITNSAGGRSMDFQWLLDLLNEVGKDLLKINVVLDASHGATPPEGFCEKFREVVKAFQKGHANNAKVASALAAVAPGLMKEGEDSLSTEEILQRLPEVVEQAKFGVLYVSALKAEALKWFDSANVNKDAAEPTDLQKQMRARIEASADPTFIGEQLALFKGIAEKGFGLNRSSQAEDLTAGGGKPKLPTGRQADISKSVKKLFGGGDK